MLFLLVFYKNGAIQTVPSLSKRLKFVTEPVIGLQFVWEYRSPSKSVQPHYQCKLCNVPRLQNDMVAHITGWKHYLKYLKRVVPDKVPYDENDKEKVLPAKKEIRTLASEVESREGRGQMKVVFKEPGDIPVVQDMQSARPNPGPSMGPVSRGGGSGFGSGFPEPLFSGDFYPRSGLMADFPEMRGGMENDFGGNFGPDSMQRFSNSRSMHLESDGFGISSLNDDVGGSYLNDLPMNNSRDRMMGQRESESGSTLATLLSCLDKFRIECEDDAQIVLKITQKLTDVLMEYRLRSISSGGITSNQSSSLGNFSSHMPISSSDRFSDRFSSEQFSGDRFSGDRFPGERFPSMSGGSSRYYN